LISHHGKQKQKTLPWSKGPLTCNISPGFGYMSVGWSSSHHWYVILAHERPGRRPGPILFLCMQLGHHIVCFYTICLRYSSLVDSGWRHPPNPLRPS
jgi:hypothetical protein